jgi:hypothetical protein
MLIRWQNSYMRAPVTMKPVNEVKILPVLNTWEENFKKGM